MRLIPIPVSRAILLVDRVTVNHAARSLDRSKYFTTLRHCRTPGLPAVAAAKNEIHSHELSVSAVDVLFEITNLADRRTYNADNQRGIQNKSGILWEGLLSERDCDVYCVDKNRTVVTFPIAN